jgi:hypothetical protein
LALNGILCVVFMAIKPNLALLQQGTVKYSLGGLKAAGVRKQLSIDQCIASQSL